jgi:hypothetical protein
MALNDHDQARIRDYLLGHLSDEEQEKIEERLMTEDDLFDELEISKCELIEEYCAGELSRNEHEWFEQHYLASLEGRRTHATAVALNAINCQISAPRKLTWFERLRDFFTAHRWAVAAAASAAVLILVIGPSIYPPTPSTSYAFTLKSTVSNRSVGEARYFKVPLSAGIGELRITLQLPEGVTRGTDYRVQLDDRGEVTKLKAASYDANSVVVVIPTTSLHEGLYALQLYAVKPDGTDELIPGEYLFELVNSTQVPSTPKP